MPDAPRLKIGLPKGSLQEPTFALFARAGFHFKTTGRSYQPYVDDPEIEPILLRPQEIPGYLEQGVLDCGLTGKDWIEDAGASVRELCELRYSKVTNNPIKIVLAVHEDSDIRTPEDLAGKRVATEYVRLSERWFAARDIAAKVEFSWGADEVKVPGLVDAIVVNTETGSSLRAHDLRVIEILLVSTTRFVAGESAWADPWKREKMEGLEILLTGAMRAASLVGLKLNLPKSKQPEILGLLHAQTSPTLSPLADEAWLAAEVILSEREVRDLVPALKRAGATALVEYPLNKVIP